MQIDHNDVNRDIIGAHTDVQLMAKRPDCRTYDCSAAFYCVSLVNMVFLKHTGKTKGEEPKERENQAKHGPEVIPEKPERETRKKKEKKKKANYGEELV
jgi:hypothetical protein